MKKTFPVIFVLIALSILGILFIQISWLQGLMFLQKKQISDKLNQSGVLVSHDVSKKMNSGLSFRLPKKGLASETYAIQGGFVEVINNQATVLVEGVL